MNMNVDKILETMNAWQVKYLLIGGMNFLLRHAPHNTFDVDLWIRDDARNLNRCEAALSDLQAEWGASDADWGLVSQKPSGWLGRQSVYCLNTPYGAVDIFRALKGVDDWDAASQAALPEKTTGGVSYLGLSDRDMLSCQLALDPSQRRGERVKFLQAKLGQP